MRYQRPATMRYQFGASLGRWTVDTSGTGVVLNHRHGGKAFRVTVCPILSCPNGQAMQAQELTCQLRSFTKLPFSLSLSLPPVSRALCLPYFSYNRSRLLSSRLQTPISHPDSCPPLPAPPPRPAPRPNRQLGHVCLHVKPISTTARR